MKNAQDVIVRYLQDAIAAETSFENQLRSFAKDGSQPEAHALFEQHADETKQQIASLQERLRLLNGKPSGIKSALANLFGMTPKTAQIGSEQWERVTQNLMVAFSVENSEVAMYEALAIAAREGGDPETEQLARRIQEQEKAAAEKIFALLPAMAERSYREVVDKPANVGLHA